MHDTLDETPVGRIPTGEAFRQRFSNPNAAIHRADVHMSLLEGAQEAGSIEVATSTTVTRRVSPATQREPTDKACDHTHCRGHHPGWSRDSIQYGRPT